MAASRLSVSPSIGSPIAAAAGGGQVASEMQPMSPNGFSSRRNTVRPNALDIDGQIIKPTHVITLKFNIVFSCLPGLSADLP